MTKHAYWLLAFCFLSVSALNGCSSITDSQESVVTENMTDVERFDALRGVNGSLRVSYDYTYPLADSIGKQHVVIGRWLPGRSSLTRFPASNETVIQERLRSNLDSEGVIVCEEMNLPEDMLASCSENPRLLGVFHEALNNIESLNESITYRGERNVSGAQCHAFNGTAPSSLTDGFEHLTRFDICLNESTGAPLSFNLGTQDPRQDNTIISLRAQSFNTTVNTSQVGSWLPFRAVNGYVDDDIHAVVKGFSDQTTTVYFGDANTTRNISLSGDQTTYVQVSGADAGLSESSEAVLNRQEGVPQLRVCHGDWCDLGRMDPCLANSDENQACSEASRCRMNDASICVERPRTCYNIPVSQCGDIQTLGGEPCRVERGECRPESS